MWSPLRGSDTWSEPPAWPPSDLSARSNQVTARLIVALVLAGTCGYVSYAATRLPGFVGQDFRVWWLGANAVLHHRNPYTTIVYDHHPDLLYPLIGALLSVPLAGIQETIAGPLFVAISCGLLAFMVTRTSWWPLFIFVAAAGNDASPSAHTDHASAALPCFAIRRGATGFAERSDRSRPRRMCSQAPTHIVNEFESSPI